MNKEWKPSRTPERGSVGAFVRGDARTTADLDAAFARDAARTLDSVTARPAVPTAHAFRVISVDISEADGVPAWGVEEHAHEPNGMHPRTLCECGHDTETEALACAEPRSIEGLARRAFDAYNAQAGGLTWDGKKIPPFDAVGPKVQANWRAAVAAVVGVLGVSTTPYEPAPPLCPIDLRRSVPARIVEDIDAPGGQPGDLWPMVAPGESTPHGYGYRCVGCGMETHLPIAPAPATSPGAASLAGRPHWKVTDGDPMTGVGLTLSPSIWHHGGRDGCEWHGWLRDGVFVPC